MRTPRGAKLGAVLLCLALVVTGCATASKGRSQTIHVGSKPEGAICAFTREGESLGTVNTPAAITVTRSKAPINVLCTKPGYDDARTVMNSLTLTGPSGPGIIGGVMAIGTVIDMASGADTNYQTALMVSLEPLSAADQAARPGKPAPKSESSPPAAPETSVPRGVYDGTYEGGIDVLQTNVSPPVPHRRDFSLQVRNGIVTGTVRHVLCDQPGEVFLVIDSSGSIQGKANTQNTTGCTERMAMIEGRMDGSDMRLTLRLRENPTVVLKRVSNSTTAPAVAAAPSAGQFDGEYRSGIELASGDLRQLWIRVRGAKATGTSRVALCPNPGAVSMNLDPSGTITGEADLQTSSSCNPRKATLSGHAEGKQLVMTASFADGTSPREFTFNRLSRGAGVDD